MKKINKKHKFNFVKFLIVAIILYIVGFMMYNLAMMPIKHIRILNTTILSDQKILKEAKLDDYPSFLLTRTSSIKKKLKKDPFIKNIRVEKKWFYKIYIYVDEYRALFYNRNLGQVVLENNNTIKNNDMLSLPQLINYVPDTIYRELIKQMATVNNDILLKISEIEYRPNDVDKERFLLSMNDGKYVYITLYTFSKINNYSAILATLENEKGILYLDSGNYFEIIH